MTATPISLRARSDYSLCWLRRVLCCGAMLLGCTSAFAVGTEEAAIRQLIAHHYDRPEKRVSTAPIVVVEDYAIADWLQGKRGGRALLQKNKDGWSILACGGDGFRDPAQLASAGIPENKARQLANALASAEKGLPAEQVKRFGLFNPGEMATQSRHH